jgi:hypothetical protein
MGYYATAQILIGNPIESFMDRFTPQFVIYLAENSRPSLVLNSTSIHQDDAIDFEQVIWVPTLENMLEDALLMIVLYLHKDKAFIEVADKYFELKSGIECYDIPEEGRSALYEMLKGYRIRDYLIVTVFEGSSLTHQVERIKDYEVNGEICCSKSISDLGY